MEHKEIHLSAKTRYCAVFGHPIKHSASPAMQNAGVAALGLDWKYLAFDVRPEELEKALEGAAAMRFIGLNLTVPHKLLAFDLVDLLDQSAQKWGAVNTIRFEARKGDQDWEPMRSCSPDEIEEIRTVGFNTDADAIIRSIEEDLEIWVAGTNVLLLGAGGAGRTAALKLAECGVRHLHLINRTRSKAEQVAKEIAERYPEVSCDLDYPAHQVDLVLNATSLGLSADDPLPLAQERFDMRKARAAYDMIYRPAETGFLKLARTAGCRTANGAGMLLYQGAKALEIWSGRTAPITQMRAALHHHLYSAG